MVITVPRPRRPPPRPRKSKISVGGWRLVGNTLTPKEPTLLAYCASISKLPDHDPLITFHFPSTFDTVSIHKSRLSMAGGPLSALVNNGFAESTQKSINLSESDSAPVFAVIRDFLYLYPIHMPAVDTVGLALASHRWALSELFEAYFIHARLSAAASTPEKVLSLMPLLSCNMPIPQHFRQYLAVNIALNFNPVMEAVLELHAAGDHAKHFDTAQASTSKLGHHRKGRSSSSRAFPGVNTTTTESAKPQFSHGPITKAPSTVLGQKSASEHLLIGEPTASSLLGPKPSKELQSSSQSREAARSVSRDRHKRVLNEDLTSGGVAISSGKRPKCAQEEPKRPQLPFVAQASERPSSSGNLVETIWHILHSHGILQHVFYYVTRYYDGDYSELFLDVILRQLEPVLKDEEVIDLLKHLNWESVCYARVLRSSAYLSWKTRAMWLLAVAQASMVSRGESELRLTWSFESLTEQVKDKGSVKVKSDTFPYKDHRFRFIASCGNCMEIDIVLIPSRTVPLPKDVRVWVRVRAIEKDCGCGNEPPGPRRSVRGMGAFRLDGLSGEDPVPLKAFTGSTGLAFVLDSNEFSHWARKRKPSCSLVVQAQLRFGKVDDELGQNKITSDIGITTQQEAIVRAQMLNRNRRRTGAFSTRCNFGVCHSPSLSAEDDDPDDNESDSEIDNGGFIGGNSEEQGTLNFFSSTTDN